MKFDLTNWKKNWEKDKKRIFFLIVWPMAISTVINIFGGPFVLHASPKLALLTPLLGVIVFMPFIVIDARRQKAVIAHEKQALQTQHDAQDKAMFGKPLRELEL